MNAQMQPPPGVVASLQRQGARLEDLVVFFATDINLDGVYAPQWVLASHTKVWVMDESRPDKPIRNISIPDVKEFRTFGVVGSGLLQARVDGMWVDLVRYSNRMKHPFGQVARRLDNLRKGEAVSTEPLELQDPQLAQELEVLRLNSSTALRRILSLLTPYWGWGIAMMALLLGGIALDMVWPLLTRFLVDWVLSNDTPAGPHPVPSLEGLPPAQVLLIVVGSLAAVQILRAVVTVFNGRLASRVGTEITYDIRGKLVQHLEKLSLSYYDRQQSGSLVGRVAYDTEAVQGFMSQLTAGFLMQILMVIFSLLMMFSLEPQLALWTLLPAPFVATGTFIFYRFVYPHYCRFWDRSSKQAGLLSSILTGIRVVKAFGQEDHELARFDKSSSSLRDARHRVDMSAATFYPVMALVFQIGGWIVWYFGGLQVLETKDGNEGISLGTLMAFFGYLGMFYGPLSSLTNMTTWLTQFTTQMHRIFEVLDAPITVRDAADPVRIPQVRGDIEFRDVTFGYSKQNPVTKGMTFKIEAGQTIGVVGRSGSGKTTLINLICRFYDADEGSVLIDGVDVKDLDRNDLRDAVSVVLQEPFLFRGTIWENLTYGKHDATIEQVIAASRAGNSHDFLMRQVAAYDTWVGERGTGLSGGERQRLSIARALLRDPRILILDEATSSVDSESELAIQKALAELVKDRTSIIIAHRLSTLRNCDRILVVDEGKLAEQGTHDELMAINGKYAKLVRIQGGASEGTSVDSLLHQDEEKQAEEKAGIEGDPDLAVDPVTQLPAMTGHRPRWLSPDFVRIHLGNHDALHTTIMNERIYHGVYALRCLPVSHPREYISLRYINEDNREQEIGLLRRLDDWPEESQKLVEEALGRRYFVHHVLRVRAVRQLQNYLEVKVDSDLGPLTFTMRYSSDAAHDYGVGGKILIDVEEIRFLIPDVKALPEGDRKLFERYIYW